MPHEATAIAKVDLTKLPIFGREEANCVNCELQPQCYRAIPQIATAYRPTDFNGLMIVGEGPGQQEVAQGRPFVGPSGKLLQAMLEQSGIDMNRCYISNATIGKPPPHKKGLMQDFPKAVESCLPRLEAEIAAVKPKIILALGGPALISLTGYDVPKVYRTPIECKECNEHRKVGPVIQCSTPLNGSPCHWTHFFPNATSPEQVSPDDLLAIKSKPCPKCNAKLNKLRPKMIKCLSCGGRKFEHKDGWEFNWDYNITDVAGAIFVPQANAAKREQHEFGKWLADLGVQYLMGSYHPAFILRDQQFIAESVLKHFARVERLLNGHKPKYKLDFEITKDPKRVQTFIDSQPKDTIYYCDIESDPKIDTEGKALNATFPPEVAVITILGIEANGKQLVIDTRDVDPSAESDPLLDVIAGFLVDETKKKVWHNGACYDLPTMDLVWGVSAKVMARSYHDDTLGLHAELYPDEPHNLAHVTFSSTDAFPWKPERRVNGRAVHETFEEKGQYNARDVYNTGRAHRKLVQELAPNKLQKVAEIDQKIRRIGVEMTMTGMPVNLEKRQDIINKATKLHADAKEATLKPLFESGIADRLLGMLNEKTRAKGINLASPPQLQYILYHRDGFGLTPTSYSDGGAPSTKEEVIHGLMATVRDDVVRKFLHGLLEVRGESKTLSTFLLSPEAQPWPVDGRIHSIWKPWGAKTGRFSSESINQQNQPKWLRSMYEARKGRKIVGADEDQLELRALGALSGDPILIDKCMNADEKRKLEPDHDPHSFVASVAFGNVYTSLLLKDPAHDKDDLKCKCQTCKRKALRDLIKRVIYGLNYGSGDKTVLAAIYSKGDYHGPPIDLATIAHVRKVVFSLFKLVPAWRDEIVATAQATCELRSPLHNRRRLFPLNEIPVTEAYNYPIQSFAADLMNEKLIEFRELLPSLDPSAMILAQVHDAIYVECDEDKAELVSKRLGEVMTAEFVLREGAPPMKFTASGSIAQNWKDAA